MCDAVEQQQQSEKRQCGEISTFIHSNKHIGMDFYGPARFRETRQAALWAFALLVLPGACTSQMWCGEHNDNGRNSS